MSGDQSQRPWLLSSGRSLQPWRADTDNRSAPLRERVAAAPPQSLARSLISLIPQAAKRQAAIQSASMHALAVVRPGSKGGLQLDQAAALTILLQVRSYLFFYDFFFFFL